MTRRVISLWLPYLATEKLARHRLLPSDRPAALVMMGGNRMTLAALNPAAVAAGLRPGQALADAHALEPALVTRPHAPAADHRLLAALGFWCDRYSPWTAPETDMPAGQGGIWLDITGCAHLFGGETALLADLLGRLRRFGFTARAAIADTPGAAWALARFDRRAAGGLVLTGQPAREALAALPVAALRLATPIVGALEHLGLRRIGQLIGMARGPLAARFGEMLCRRLDQALGRLAEPISPQPRRTAPSRSREFAEPVGNPAVIAASLQSLLVALCTDLAQARRGVSRLEVTAWQADGGERRLELGTAHPGHDPVTLFRLLTLSMERFELGDRIERLRLTAGVTEPLGAGSTGQLADSGLAGGGTEVVALLDRLAARLGGQAVTRLAPQARHLPEQAERRVPAGAGAVLPAPASSPSSSPTPSLAPRPIRLLRRPEPVDLLPGPAFHWRGRAYPLQRWAGPERIAAEWWREPRGRDRDYYRVEDRAGQRFWLCRQGRDWFLHGLFA